MYAPCVHMHIGELHVKQRMERDILLTYLLTYVRTYLPTYLLTYLPTYLRTYVPTYLRTYVPTYLRTYLPTYLLTYLTHLLTGELHVKQRMEGGLRRGQGFRQQAPAV